MSNGQQGPSGEYQGGVQVLQTGRLREEYREEIDYLDTDKNLLDRLMKGMGKETVGRMEHNWQVQERKKDFVAFSAIGGAWAGGADSAGSFTVAAADAFLFAIGDVFKAPEASDTRNFYVTAVDLGTGVITAETVDTQTIDLSGGLTDQTLFRVANSFESGTGRGTIKTEQPDEISNYVQILQTPMGITTTAKNLNYRGVNEWDKIRLESGIDHMFSKEKLFFFGEKHRDAVGRMEGNYEQWFMGGLTEYISTHVEDIAGGALTQAEFKDWLVACTKYSDMSTIFTGELIYEALTQWAETKLELVRSESTLGMAVANYQTPYGKQVALIPHRELLKDSYTGTAFCVDLKDLKYITVQGLDDHLEIDIQDPDRKQKIDEWRTWISMRVLQEKRHGYMKNVGSISNA